MEYAPLIPLETRHLRLRKMKAEDASLYFARLGGSEAVVRGMLFQPHKDISESVASVEKNLRRYEAGRHYHWVITLKESDELIGVISLLGFEENRSRCSFAYMLGEDFWGKGYGTEAVKEALNFAFGKLGIEVVEADHFAHNPASGAVMRKAGMICTGVINGKYEKNGQLIDAPQYVITKEMWMKKD